MRLSGLRDPRAALPAPRAVRAAAGMLLLSRRQRGGAARLEPARRAGPAIQLHVPQHGLRFQRQHPPHRRHLLREARRGSYRPCALP
eukprot:3240896-Prymnesium_polylepis.1